jgi:hypothetical protein
MNPALLRSMQNSVYAPISLIVKDEARPFFLEERHLASRNRFPYLVNPYAFLDYQEESIVSRIRQMGWQRVTDTDENSTNCRLNGYANAIHYGRYGYHPYASAIARMVRTGKLHRDEGLRRLGVPQENQIVASISKEINR